MKPLLRQVGPLVLILLVMAWFGSPQSSLLKGIHPGLDRFPYGGWELVAAVLVLMILSWIRPRIAARMVGVVIALGLLACAVGNAGRFAQINESEPYRLERHRRNTLYYLSQKSPSLYERESLGPYFFLLHYLRGSRIIAYSEGIFDQHRLRTISRLALVVNRDYRPELSAAEASRLLAGPHTILTIPEHKEMVVVVDDQRPASPPDYCLLKAGDRHFLVPAHRFSG